MSTIIVYYVNYSCLCKQLATASIHRFQLVDRNLNV